MVKLCVYALIVIFNEQLCMRVVYRSRQVPDLKPRPSSRIYLSFKRSIKELKVEVEEYKDER